MRLRDLAATRPRYGYRRLWVLLRREGWAINHKLVHRLYVEEGLQVRSKRRKKRAARVRVAPSAPAGVNQRWAIDFVRDVTASGRALRVFTAIDVFSRECLTLHVASSIRSLDVTHALDRVIFHRGAPTTIQCDNGSEFACNHFDQWAHERGVRVDFIRPGRPVENAHVESFNGRLRDECLNAHWFVGLDDARRTIEDWRRDYNETRPH